ncbi:hypothetical protein CAEBREN_28701 [Caenorhabditis brenneri]|uniref:Uncharacterized protein n=1 Tax=Caenorhabditis brenneri TaxID=135651 RepID=G0NE86_CAEBE|nr:hypothetical protein CAEBREN_28701 [Caenorhabditis brenneri]
MKTSMRGPFIFILGVTFSGFLFSLHYTRSREIQEPIKPSVLQVKTQQQPQVGQSRVISSTSKAAPAPPMPQEPVPQEPIPEKPAPEQPKKPGVKKEEASEDCNCISEKTGKSHNFCYQDPQNETSFGRKFDCDRLKILEKLNLVDNPGPFVDLSKTEENSKQIVFVSAVSDNHFNEATTSIAAFYRFYPNGHFILYSLGLHEIYTTNIKKDFNKLEVRVFNVTGYPDYVINWMEYRFKPLILAEVMKEFSNVWWMDAHIVVKKPMMVELLYNEIAENVKKAETEVAQFRDVFDADHVEQVPKIWPTTDDAPFSSRGQIPI